VTDEPAHQVLDALNDKHDSYLSFFIVVLFLYRNSIGYSEHIKGTNNVNKLCDIYSRRKRFDKINLYII